MQKRGNSLFNPKVFDNETFSGDLLKITILTYFLKTFNVDYKVERDNDYNIFFNYNLNLDSYDIIKNDMDLLLEAYIKKSNISFRLYENYVQLFSGDKCVGDLMHNPTDEAVSFLLKKHIQKYDVFIDFSISYLKEKYTNEFDFLKYLVDRNRIYSFLDLKNIKNSVYYHPDYNAIKVYKDREVKIDSLINNI